MFTDPMTFSSAIGKLFTEEALILGGFFFGGLYVEITNWLDNQEQYEEEYEEEYEYEVETDRDIPVKRMGKKVGKVKM